MRCTARFTDFLVRMQRHRLPKHKIVSMCIFQYFLGWNEKIDCLLFYFLLNLLPISQWETISSSQTKGELAGKPPPPPGKWRGKWIICPDFACTRRGGPATQLDSQTMRQWWAHQSSFFRQNPFLMFPCSWKVFNPLNWDSD